ncbi:hypothetical protein PRVXH_002677 [Proteinivorax hydrogeniformans]|uniref:Peptidase MA-like domain-containing protein n=1 Tax=Proteinivorax hydrogeniformans TaxID=1826727 RepID=A0AAU8HSZ7_9FIRM
MKLFKKDSNAKVLLFISAIVFTVMMLDVNPVNLSYKPIKDATSAYHRNVAYRNWESTEGEFVELRYKQVDRKHSDFMQSLGDKMYLHLQDKYNFKPKTTPLIVIYPTQQKMLQSLGWDSDKSVSGVYQSGTIRLLSPTQWYRNEVDLETTQQFYKKNGPLLHEMTHYFVDEMTFGNYPTWYTEAVAQLEEYKKFNIQWLDDQNTDPQELYPLEKLVDNFYAVENQSLAYRQALVIAIFMEDKFGHNIHKELLDKMDVRISFEQALKITTGTTQEELKYKWQSWILQNRNKYFG